MVQGKFALLIIHWDGKAISDSDETQVGHLPTLVSFPNVSKLKDVSKLLAVLKLESGKAGIEVEVWI